MRAKANQPDAITISTKSKGFEENRIKIESK